MSKHGTLNLGELGLQVRARIHLQTRLVCLESLQANRRNVVASLQNRPEKVI